MALENSGMSIGDVLALTKGEDGNFLGGSTGGILALIIVFILLFGGNGFGFGGNRGYEQYATSAEVQRGFDNQNVMQSLNSIGNGICSSTYDIASRIADTNYNVSQVGTQVGGAVTELGYQMQNCCCTTNRNIDSLRYDAQLNTRDITDAIHYEGQTTRALINENTIQQLREDLQSAQLTLANANQTQNLLNAMGRYVTNPPCYQNYSCGCNSGVTIA